MLSRKLDEWCRGVRERFEREFGYSAPGEPESNAGAYESTVYERMMRCGIEARHFNDDFREDGRALAILAHHTLLLDDIEAGRGSNSWTRYHQTAEMRRDFHEHG